MRSTAVALLFFLSGFQISSGAEIVLKQALYEDSASLEAAIASVTPERKWLDGGHWVAQGDVPSETYMWMAANISPEFVSHNAARVSLPDSPSGQPRILLVQTSTPNSPSYNCHACGAILSAYALRLVNGQIIVDASAPYLGSAGQWGMPPDLKEMKAIPVGKEGFLFAIVESSVGQGSYARWVSLIGLIGSKIAKLGVIELDEDNLGECGDGEGQRECMETIGSFKMVAGQGLYKDLLVIRMTKTAGEKAKTQVARYRLETSPSLQYREVDEKINNQK